MHYERRARRHILIHRGAGIHFLVHGATRKDKKENNRIKQVRSQVLRQPQGPSQAPALLTTKKPPQAEQVDKQLNIC